MFGAHKLPLRLLHTASGRAPLCAEKIAEKIAQNSAQNSAESSEEKGAQSGPTAAHCCPPLKLVSPRRPEGRLAAPGPLFGQFSRRKMRALTGGGEANGGRRIALEPRGQMGAKSAPVWPSGRPNGATAA